MFLQVFQSDYKKPFFLFCIGWCLVLLAGWVPFSRLQTFIHTWRVETAASVFLLITLAYLLYQHRAKIFKLGVFKQEINFIVLPLLAFIIWSGFSMLWADSWQSALFHTLIWTEYLIFYLIIRHILNLQGGYKHLIILLTLVFVIIGMPAIIEYGSHLYLVGETTLGVRYAKYGEQINTFSPLFIIGILRLNGKPFLIGLATFSVLWLFIISTLGRTNLILFVSGLVILTGLIFTFRNFRKYRRKMAVIFLFFLLSPIPLHSIALLAEKPDIPLMARLNETEGITYSGNFRKLLWSISADMFIAHPIIGIGADNFGIEFNKYRKIHAERNPADVNLAVAEDDLAERSHNEYLQILSELGIIGGLIFICFLSSIFLLFINILKNLRTTSLIPLAAFLGLVCFLANSLLSSYSFRLIQNGFVFFFVLAVACKFLFKPKKDKHKAEETMISPPALRLSYGVGMAACLLVIAYCGIRVASVAYAADAYQEKDIDRAGKMYQTAFLLDEENPENHFNYGIRLLNAERYAEAAAQFEQTIAKQWASSTVYSYLATAQSLAGDNTGAEKTFSEAVVLYPLSPFVRTRYASLLKTNGRIKESEEQLDIAIKLDQKQTGTWWTLMNSGLVAAKQQFLKDKKIADPEYLKPAAAFAAVKTDRELKFPSEKLTFNFDN